MPESFGRGGLLRLSSPQLVRMRVTRKDRFEVAQLEVPERPSEQGEQVGASSRVSTFQAFSWLMLVRSAQVGAVESDGVAIGVG